MYSTDVEESGFTPFLQGFGLCCSAMFVPWLEKRLVCDDDVLDAKRASQELLKNPPSTCLDPFLLPGASLQAYFLHPLIYNFTSKLENQPTRCRPPKSKSTPPHRSTFQLHPRAHMDAPQAAARLRRAPRLGLRGAVADARGAADAVAVGVDLGAGAAERVDLGADRSTDAEEGHLVVP